MPYGEKFKKCPKNILSEKKKIIMYFAYHVTPNSQMAKDNPLVLHSTQKGF